MRGIASRGRRTTHRWLLLALLPALWTGCRGTLGDGLGPARVVRLPAEVADASALHVGPDGHVWLGGPGWAAALDTSARTVVRRRAVPGDAAVSVLGLSGRRVYLRIPDRLLALDAELEEISGEREAAPTDPFAFDPRGRAVFQGSGGGAVEALGPAGLRARWAWPKLGPPVTALAASPEGDRLYVAMAGDSAVLLSRDVQTGRVIWRAELPAPASALAVGPDGVIYALTGEDGDATALALRPAVNGTLPIWRRSVGLEGARMRVAPRGDRVVVFSSGEEAGIRVLDAADGAVLRAAESGPLDAGWSAGGELYLLYPRELRVLVP